MDRPLQRYILDNIDRIMEFTPTKGELKAVNIVKGNPGISCLEVSGIMGKSRDTIQSVLLSAHRKGYLEREFKKGTHMNIYFYTLDD